ncbi:MAG: DUF2059 domain-containing protein [Flavobacteriales bacterium]
MKKYILISIFSLGLSFQNYSQQSELQSDIKELLELTGSGKLGLQVMNQLVENFKKAFPDVNQNFWDEFMKEINPDDLINMVIPVYEKYYTSAEITQLIAFYKTPIGQKTIAATPQITQDSMKVGQKWGRELAEKVVKKLEQSK